MSELENKNDPLKTKILSKIQGEKPESSWHFILIDSLKVAGIAALFVIGSFVLAFFVWDWTHTADFGGFDNTNAWEFLKNAMLELVVLVVLISLLIYAVYRNTDLPLVKQRGLIFVLVWVAFILTTTSLVFWIDSNRQLRSAFLQVENRIASVPYRPRPLRDQYQNQKQKNIFEGRIAQIELPQGDQIEITIGNPFEERKFILSRELLNNFAINDRIVVQTDPQEPNRIIKIVERKNPPRRPLP